MGHRKRTRINCGFFYLPVLYVNNDFAIIMLIDIILDVNLVTEHDGDGWKL